MRPKIKPADQFQAHWRMLASTRWGGEVYPEPQREFMFDEREAPKPLKKRAWRFDFAWPDALVAVEIEGGIFIHGGHNRGPMYASNCEKYNCAGFMGWTVIRLTDREIRGNPVETLCEIARLIRRRILDNCRTYDVPSYALLAPKAKKAPRKSLPSPPANGDPW